MSGMLPRHAEFKIYTEKMKSARRDNQGIETQSVIQSKASVQKVEMVAGQQSGYCGEQFQKLEAIVGELLGQRELEISTRGGGGQSLAE
jgi:hypothetical protein